MIDINIAAVANQTMSIQIGRRLYDISLRETNGCMSASISRDGVALTNNVRIVAGSPLLPYLYQEDGNFLMTVDGDALPYWDQFGVTQFLVYLTADELAAYRAS